MGVMTELLELTTSTEALIGLGVAVFVFGFFPGFVLRQIVRMYPVDHPRRAEIVAELYQLNFAMRPVWVGAQLETALHEGLGLRWTDRKTRMLAIRIEYNMRFASTMTRADLVAAAVVFQLPDPKQLSVVVDADGLHYRSSDGTRQVTAHPWLVRRLALLNPTFEGALVAEGLSAQKMMSSWGEKARKQLPTSRLILEACRCRKWQGPPQEWIYRGLRHSIIRD